MSNVDRESIEGNMARKIERRKTDVYFSAFDISAEVSTNKRMGRVSRKSQQNPCFYWVFGVLQKRNYRPTYREITGKKLRDCTFALADCPNFLNLVQFEPEVLLPYNRRT